jgi:hypothetical protein
MESDKNTRKKILDKLDKPRDEFGNTFDQRRQKKKIRINDQRMPKIIFAQING